MYKRYQLETSMVDRFQLWEIQSTKIHNSLLHKLEVIVLCYTWILSRAEHNTISDINLQLLNNRIFGSIYRFYRFSWFLNSWRGGGGGGDPDLPPPPLENYKCYSFLGISMTTSTPHPYPTASKILGLPHPPSLEIFHEVHLEWSIGTLCKK